MSKYLMCFFFITYTAVSQERLSLNQEKPRIAVMPCDVSGEIDRDVFQQSIRDAFLESIFQKIQNKFVAVKRFTVIERAAVNKIIQEQNFQLTDLADPNKAVSIGNILGAQFIVQGNVQSIRYTTSKKNDKTRCVIEMTVRYIDVKTGEIKASTSLKGRSDKKDSKSVNMAYAALDSLDKQLAAGIKKTFPIEGKVVKVLEIEDQKKKNKIKIRLLISCGTEIGVAKDDVFRVVEEETVEIDGKSYIRNKDVGKVVVTKPESDGLFSLCKILEGEEVLLSNRKNIQKYKVISAE